MIADRAALLAVIFNDADEQRFAAATIDALTLRLAGANWIAAAIVVDSRGSPTAAVRFDDLIDARHLGVMAVTMEDAHRTCAPNNMYGRGRHRARLNYDDCVDYALANRTGEPLLFRFNDFLRTDIEPASKD